MSIPIKFASEDDELAAYGIFTNEGEGYSLAPDDVYFVSRRMVEALQEAGIRFELLDGEIQGAHRAAHS